MTQIILVAGGGGVGKTTVSAGIAVRAARLGKRTLVVTVDPARRLADALGQADLGNEPSPHPNEPGLWASMLDASASWTAIVKRHADPAVAERLVDNPFFAAATSHFPASQSYAAAEQAATFADARAWELVVVDTPPAAGGIEFFTSSGAMKDLVGGRLLSWMTGGKLPGRRFFFDRATKPALRMADQILGASLLEEIAQFLVDLRTTYDGVSRRAREIDEHLSRATTVVVTTPDPAPIAEAVRFYRELPVTVQQPAAVVFNRTLPEDWIDAHPGRVDPLLADNLRRWGSESLRQLDLRSAFAARHQTPLATIEWKSNVPNDLESLESLIASAGGFDLTELLDR